jgi:ligand-binding SRPBCC domain-containing protein
MYKIEREQEIRTTMQKAWDFIKTPKNLDRITPAELEFEIVSDVPDNMFNGLIVEYIITIPFFGRRKWVAEMKHIREPFSFVDDQRVGPYRFWYIIKKTLKRIFDYRAEKFKELLSE